MPAGECQPGARKRPVSLGLIKAGLHLRLLRHAFQIEHPPCPIFEACQPRGKQFTSESRRPQVTTPARRETLHSILIDDRSYFFPFTTCFAAAALFFFCVPALAFACFCAACLFVDFGDLSPIIPSSSPAAHKSRGSNSTFGTAARITAPHEDGLHSFRVLSSTMPVPSRGCWGGARNGKRAAHFAFGGLQAAPA